MNALLEQFTNWQIALEDFQKNIEKDLEEIRKHKTEVQQMKIELIDHLDRGRYIRDENRIIISAPEIIIGNIDKSGLLQNGYSKVIIRANDIGLEGVGSGATTCGNIVSRAASIQQIASSLKHGVSHFEAKPLTTTFPLVHQEEVKAFYYPQIVWSTLKPLNLAIHGKNN